MPAPLHRSKEVLRIQREGPARLGSVISKSRISAGRLLTVVWGCAEGAGSGVCRCECIRPRRCIAWAFATALSLITWRSKSAALLEVWMIP